MSSVCSESNPMLPSRIQPQKTLFTSCVTNIQWTNGNDDSVFAVYESVLNADELHFQDQIQFLHALI